MSRATCPGTSMQPTGGGCAEGYTSVQHEVLVHLGHFLQGFGAGEGAGVQGLVAVLALQTTLRADQGL